MYVLAGGMALVLPTLVVSLNAMSYQPPPPSDEGSTGGAEAAIRLRGHEVAVGVPGVQMKNLYSKREVAQYGVQPGREVRVPLLGGAF